MKYYLLSEQDVDEIIWDLENFIHTLKEKMEDKKIKEFWETEAGSGEDHPAEG